jgi:CAAX protease family protein
MGRKNTGHDSMMTPQFRRYIAPARARAQIWRLLLGAGLITATYLAGIAAIFALLALISGPQFMLSWAMTMSNAATPAGVFLLLAGFLGAALGPMLAVRWVHKRKIATLFGPRVRVLRDFAIAALTVLVIYGALLALWSLRFDAMPNIQPARWLVLLPFALLGVLLQTGAEELVFRAYLPQQLAARFRAPWIWMVLPAVIFAALHYDREASGENTFLIIAAAGIFALIASDLTRLTGSIGAAWGFHFANNVLAVVFIAVNGSITGVSLLVTPYQADDTAVLPILILGDVAVMALAWLTLRRLLQR